MSEPWIEVLRAACATSTLREVSIRIGYSRSTISALLTGSYGKASKKPVDVANIKNAVEKALMQGTVSCPVLGDIQRQRCGEHQREKFRIGNPVAVALYAACRARCPHSLIQPADTGAEAP